VFGGTAWGRGEAPREAWTRPLTGAKQPPAPPGARAGGARGPPRGGGRGGGGGGGGRRRGGAPPPRRGPPARSLHAGGAPWALIRVAAGGTEDSFKGLTRIQAADPRVRVIQFRRNFGQTAAFAAGFAHARGALIVTADGDLQNDPRDIPAMVERLEKNGCDIVCGWRKDRKDTFINRRLPSMLANRLISWSTGVKLHDYGCSLKVFRAEVVKPLRLYGEMHRFLPALASEMGVKIEEHVVNHRARMHGTTKYGISRTIRVMLDLMTVKFLLSYSTRPLHIFGLAGLISGFVGFAICAWLTYGRLFGDTQLANKPMLLLGISLIITGLQFVTFGLLAEMQVRTYHESQSKPVYVIRALLESEKAEGNLVRDLSTGGIEGGD